MQPFAGSHSNHYFLPSTLRSPEVFLGLPTSETIDIFGYLGSPLFPQWCLYYLVCPLMYLDVTLPFCMVE